MMKKELCEKAAAYFSDGYNCAQSVLLTMFEHWNGENPVIPKIATGFGSGIGRCGSICGALTGGVMAIGIKHGTNEPFSKKRLLVYELTQKLYKKFEEENGSAFCRELIGYDLSNPEQLERAQKANVFEEKCDGIVRKTIEIVFELTES